MAITLLRDRDLVPTPWKNGGGVTRELAVWPPGAGFGDFDWRVSLATVEAGGPFSVFPGVDRTLGVIEGALTLTIEDGTPVTLAPTSAPARFAGEVKVVAAPPGRPVTDFNVMTRRGRMTATLDRLTDGGAVNLSSTGWTLIVACDRTDLVIDGGSVVLERFDALMITSETESQRLILAPCVHILLAKISFL